MNVEFPGASIVRWRRQSKAKTANGRAVDDLADIDDVIIVGNGEIDVRGESSLMADATFAQAGAAFEYDTGTLEDFGQVQ